VLRLNADVPDEPVQVEICATAQGKPGFLFGGIRGSGRCRRRKSHGTIPLAGVGGRYTGLTARTSEFVTP